MKDNYVAIFVILSFVASLQAHYTQTPHSNSRKPATRTLLHQPLFPSVAPPPRQDQPFFREHAGQSPPPPPAPPPPVAGIRSETLPGAKKIAIAISSAILTLAMMAALAFYLFKHCGDRPDESRKLVGGNSIHQDPRMAPSAFLHIGTVEPSSRSFLDDSGSGANASPYRKLSSGRRPDRYRPSPDLQPLPPLPRPAPQSRMSSPPPMTSSDDDDSHDTDFYTPQGSSISNESPSSRHSCLKGSSPKSRFSASSPDKKPVITPPIKQSLPPPQSSKARSYTPFRFKFPPPPLPDRARLGLINSDNQRNPKIPIPPRAPSPPPPPPPPPQLTIPRKIGGVETHKSSPLSKQAINPQSMIITPKSNSATGEAYKIVDSSEIAIDRDEKDGSKPKLKPLHWDKVRATSDRATVWDQLNSNSFPLNEDAMESLFGCNSANSASKEVSREPVRPTKEENRVLDPKKSQNIAILLRALNVTIEEVSEALLDGNPEGLGPELLETLVKMAPTKEEEIKLKRYGGESTQLGSAERFLKAIIDIPFAFKRVEAMLYRANFDTEVAYLRKSFQTMEEASAELKNSRLFLKLLEAVLRTGNRMNDGTNRGDARAFKLDTLLKLVDVKGTDGKTTLLHFVVQEIIRLEGAASNSEDKTDFKFKEEEFKKQGLQVVSGLSQELGNVKRAAGMDSDVLSSYVAKLETGLDKLRLVLQYEKRDRTGKFLDSMEEFHNEATEKIAQIKAEERKAISVVKEATQYFHGDAAKEEAHPLRIFMIVRDFLAILDSVCKDIRRMQKGQATIGLCKSFRIPTTAAFPVANTTDA